MKTITVQYLHFYYEKGTHKRFAFLYPKQYIFNLEGKKAPQKHEFYELAPEHHQVIFIDDIKETPNAVKHQKVNINDFQDPNMGINLQKVLKQLTNKPKIEILRKESVKHVKNNN